MDRKNEQREPNSDGWDRTSRSAGPGECFRWLEQNKREEGTQRGASELVTGDSWARGRQVQSYRRDTVEKNCMLVIKGVTFPISFLIIQWRKTETLAAYEVTFPCIGKPESL